MAHIMENAQCDSVSMQSTLSGICSNIDIHVDCGEPLKGGTDNNKFKCCQWGHPGWFLKTFHPSIIGLKINRKMPLLMIWN